MPKNRHHCITHKVHTQFGAMYIHVELNDKLQPVGGSISTPGKEPESQIQLLVSVLSEGIGHALSVAVEEED